MPWARDWLGASGVHAAAALSGLADVDAIVIAVTRMYSVGDLALADWLLALNLATLSNTLAKAGIAWASAGKAFSMRMLAACAVAVLPELLVLAMA